MENNKTYQIVHKFNIFGNHNVFIQRNVEDAADVVFYLYHNVREKRLSLKCENIYLVDLELFEARTNNAAFKEMEKKEMKMILSEEFFIFHFREKEILRVFPNGTFIIPGFMVRGNKIIRLNNTDMEVESCEDKFT